MAGGICQAKEIRSIKAVRRGVCLVCVAGAVRKRMWAGGRAREVTGQIPESSKGLGEDFYFILKPMRAFSEQGRDMGLRMLMVLAEKLEKMSAKILDEMKLAWSQVSSEGAEKSLGPECIFKGMRTK